MAITRAWRVFGETEHRQRESFSPSYLYDFSTPEKNPRIIEVLNSDRTGTNDYTVVLITRATWDECGEEFHAQLFDGIFENSRTGRIEEVRL